jgi:hypothetical protein
MTKVDQAEAQNTADSENPVVWVSGSKGYVGSQSFGSQTYLTLDQMKSKILAWDGARNPQYNNYVNKLVASGFMDKSYADQSNTAANALGYAVKVYQAYAKEGGNLNFDDWFDWYSSTAKPEGDGGGAYRGPVTTVTTTITDPTTAEAVLDKFARETLGRALTKKETERYLSEYRQIEEENPQVTTTTPVGKARRETVTETQPSKEEMLRQVLSQNPDYQKFQIDTTIMDLLLEDIKAGQEVIRG